MYECVCVVYFMHWVCLVFLGWVVFFFLHVCVKHPLKTTRLLITGGSPSRRRNNSHVCGWKRPREATLCDNIYPVLAALQPTKAIYTHIDHSLLFISQQNLFKSAKDFLFLTGAPALADSDL